MEKFDFARGGDLLCAQVCTRMWKMGVFGGVAGVFLRDGVFGLGAGLKLGAELVGLYGLGWEGI